MYESVRLFPSSCSTGAVPKRAALLAGRGAALALPVEQRVRRRTLLRTPVLV